MEGYRYELFVRKAFGYKLKKIIDRGEDPNGLAEADIFCNSKLTSVKKGVAESMKIFVDDIVAKIKPNDSEKATLVKFIRDVEKTNDIKEISALINSFNIQIFNKYYDIVQGVITFRQY